jgi:hypothetical protein
MRAVGRGRGGVGWGAGGRRRSPTFLAQDVPRRRPCPWLPLAPLLCARGRSDRTATARRQHGGSGRGRGEQGSVGGKAATAESARALSVTVVVAPSSSSVFAASTCPYSAAACSGSSPGAAFTVFCARIHASAAAQRTKLGGRPPACTETSGDTRGATHDNAPAWRAGQRLTRTARARARRRPSWPPGRAPRPPPWRRRAEGVLRRAGRALCGAVAREQHTAAQGAHDADASAAKVCAAAAARRAARAPRRGTHPRQDQEEERGCAKKRGRRPRKFTRVLCVPKAACDV